MYVASRDRVEARDGHTGAVQWRVALPRSGPRDAIAQVASDAELAAVANPTRLLVYDHAGDPLYSVRLKSPPGAVFVEPGRIYVNHGGRTSRGCH